MRLIAKIKTNINFENILHYLVKEKLLSSNLLSNTLYNIFPSLVWCKKEVPFFYEGHYY